MTGLRRGEICGLKWQDINFEENKLQVKRSVSVKKGGGVSIGETKTETGVRSILMPPSVAEVLQNRKQRAITEWVFPNFMHPEQPISPATAYRKLKIILKHAGLPLIRFHDLRHTFATHATHGGVDPKTLAGILGHTNASFTLDTYTHVTSDMQNSVANQKKLLTKYAKENGFANTRFYVDDGYTGTNFNRPGFQKLLEDMEMGYVSAIIVKDMSRLGRDYLQVGYYTDTFFPDHNIRFIAINDCVDSDDGENELAPFRNVMNEMYARDISRKVRSSHRLRGNAGEPLSQPPYGYMKSPENKKQWIIDPEAAQIVKEIFAMCIEGKGNETIARILQERQVLVPMAYWQSKGLDRGGKKTQANPYKWCKTTIAKILAQQEYCGDIINFKTYSKSFKNKTRISNSKENWAIFKDRHEPIIDRETFEQVQKLTGKTKR